MDTGGPVSHADVGPISMPITSGIEPVIPRRSNQPAPQGEHFDRNTYRKRCRIEQAVGWLKECRRLGTRYDKLGLNFLAFVKLGIMMRYLRKLDPSDRT